MSAELIWPSRARCMLVGHTARTKSTVFGEAGSTVANGSEARLASTNFLACRSQFAEPDLVMVIWFVSLVNIMLPSLVASHEIHLKAASLFLQAEKIALDSSPKMVHAPPSGLFGTGTAPTLSAPSACSISFAVVR